MANVHDELSQRIKILDATSKRHWRKSIRRFSFNGTRARSSLRRRFLPSQKLKSSLGRYVLDSTSGAF